MLFLSSSNRVLFAGYCGFVSTCPTSDSINEQVYAWLRHLFSNLFPFLLSIKIYSNIDVSSLSIRIHSIDRSGNFDRQ